MTSYTKFRYDSDDTLFATSYVRDSLSRITQLTERVNGTTQVVAFTYDSVGRLSSVTRNGTPSASYTYDANGNRATKTTSGGTQTAQVDDQDRLTSYAGVTYQYTAHGDLRRKIVGTDTTEYTYDALGNLTRVELPTGTVIGYLLDAMNRRIGKTVNDTLVRAWLYQGQLTPVAELDGAGNVVSRFVYATGVNVPDYLVRGDSTYRIIRDHLGSVRLVVNVASGTIAQRVSYDEFGIETENTNPGWQPFGYAGGLTESQTGLVRFGARDYDPVVGRWTAKDPIGFAGGATSLYQYAANDPVSLVDPTGKIPLFPVAAGAAAGAFGGAAESIALQLALNGCVDWGQVGVDALIGAAGGAIGGFLTTLRLADKLMRRAYRAVSKAELDDINDLRKFRQRPDGGSMEDKWFSETREGAEKFAQKSRDLGWDKLDHIVEADVPLDVYNKSHRVPDIDGTGPGFSVESGLLSQLVPRISR